MASPLLFWRRLKTLHEAARYHAGHRAHPPTPPVNPTRCTIRPEYLRASRRTKMATESLTYAQIAERLGINVEAARGLVRRRHLPRSTGNDGRTVILVDLAEIASARKRGGVQEDSGRPRLEELLAPGTKRWVIRRKAEVVAAVRGGLLSLEEACSRYTLTVEEFRAWQCSIDRHGLAGLRTTRIQQYRQ